jgi:membrane-anchored protein YejM (alkaline phosphatase superfamily)
MIPEKLKKYISVRSFFALFVPLILVNTIISLMVTFSLVRSGYQGNSFSSFILNVIPFVSHFFLLNLAVGLVASVLSLLLGRRLIPAVIAILFILLQSLLLIDTRIYSIFHYHINALVLNVITTEGAADSVILGKNTLIMFTGWLLLVLMAEIFFTRLFLKLAEGNSPARPALLKISRALFVAGILLVALDKGIYAYGDLNNDTMITKNAKLFPLYQTFTIKRFASKVLHMKVNREENFKVPVSSLVKYPRQPLKFDAAGAQNYNIIVIVADGLRFDMLDREIMPNVWKFGKENITYADHYSGGNGTRFGIFTLFYGIHGTYWHNFLANRIPPVLIDALLEKGYDFKILSSTRLTFPEFRKTAFLKVPDSIEDNVAPEGNAAVRDSILTDKLLQYMNTRKKVTPFFAFVFYDASHQPYAYPGEFEKFRPAGNQEINYFKNLGKESIGPLKNQYKNAVYYDDYLIGKILSSLKENNLLDSTIVIICGDHGEEFFENGYFGHTSSFDDYELKTVFVMHYPGQGHRTVQRISSHLDVVPTLMESLGCTSPADDYSQGFSLLSDTHHRYVSVSNWDTAALIDDEYKIVFSTELYNLTSFEVRKKEDYAVVADSKTVLKQRKPLLLDTTLKMSEFYR